MSHNYPYRGPAKDSRPNLGTYSASDHLHSEDYNFYRQSQQPSSHLSSSTSYPPPLCRTSMGPSSSQRSDGNPSYSSQRSDNNTLSILNSCGLEPKDLSLLAELPEEVLTLESLPHLLTQIKGKRGTIKPYPPTPPSSRPTSSTHLPAASASSEWERIRNQPVQYPLDHSYLTPKPLPPEQVQDWQDRWGNPRQTGSANSKPSSSTEPSSSSAAAATYMVDYGHRYKPTDYGKKGRDDSYSSRFNRPSYSSPAVGNSSRKAIPSLLQADYRLVPPPPPEYSTKARADRCERDASYNTSRSTAQKIPPRKAALDFHGTTPVAYPYSCSLCEITVLSETYWVKHINGAEHADGQLTLLQQFPDWDCRMETIRKVEDQAEKPKDDGRTAHNPPTTTKNSYRRPNKKTQKGTASSKVVCVKFAAQSVDENYLRSLTEPFGKIVKILMFPALAFVEMGSVDQAKDLVKYYNSNPAKAKGEEITFYVSPTLNFLQSSRVVSFTPAPSGESGHADLIAIVKRFGPPLYTLFLPSLAFVEMKNAPDAQKLVEYYSSNVLKIDGETIKVVFSGEYNTLMRMSSAKKYEEESSGTKRSRSPSPKKWTDNPSHSVRRGRMRMKKSKRRRRSSGEPEEREESSSERRTRSPSDDRSSKSRCSHSSDDRSKKKASVPDKTQPSEAESKADKPAPPSSSKPEIKKETLDNEGQTKTPPASVEEPTAPAEDEAGSSGEESDIEGMEVIGEDGENLEDEDMDTLDDSDGEEEGEKEEEKGRVTTEEEAAKEDEPAETITALEKGEEEAAEEEKLEDTETREEEKDDVENGEEEEVLEEKDTETREEEKDDVENGEEEAVLEETSGIEAEEAGPASEASASRSEPQADGDAPQTTETPPEEDEEETDFPVDLENCITLDELVESEEESDNEDEEPKDETESCPGSVLYFRNLPTRYYTDAEFVRLVEDFGEVTRYFLIRSRREGFVEMSSPSEAQRAIEELRHRTVELRGIVMTAQLCRKYKRLTGGWKWEPEEEKRERRSRDSRTSERASTRSQDSNKKSVEREESTKHISKRKGSARKTPEKELSAKKTPEKERSAKKTPEKERSAKRTPEKEEPAKKTTEKEEPAKKTTEKEEPAKKTTEKADSVKKTLEKEKSAKKTPEKEEPAKKTPEKEDSAKKTPEKEDTAKKTLEKEKPAIKCEVVEEETPKEEVVVSEEVTSKPGSEDQEESEVGAVQPSHVTEDPQKVDAGKESTSGDIMMDDVEEKQTCSTAEVEQQADPVKTAEELVKPTKPVGAEFVRPVVGYFCNLCKVIYVDEDEAKNEHCSTISHYQKYKEHTGQDPWAS